MTRITRRRFLAGGSASIALLAGCTNQGNQGEGSGSGGGSATPTETTTRTPTETTTQQETSEQGEHGGNHSEGSGGNHGSGLPKQPSGDADVTMVTENGGQHFEPHLVWIEPGGTVTWTLESGAHSTTAYHPDNGKPLRIPDGASAWNSNLLSQQGTTFEHTFDAKGVYDYFCTPHESLGMIGSVVVGRPEPNGQPALEPPQAKLPGGARRKIKELNRTETKLLENR